MTPLTISKDKIAVLLRIRKPAIKAIDKMATAAGTTRTGIIYRLLAKHPRLRKLMGTQWQKKQKQ